MMLSVPARIQLHSKLFHICCLVQLGVFVDVWFCQLCPSKSFFSPSLLFSLRERERERERKREGEKERESLEPAAWNEHDRI